MKIKLIEQEALSTLKTDAYLQKYAHCYAEENASWIERVIGKNPFIDSRFEVPKFSLDTSEEKPALTDFPNTQKVYDNLNFLTPSEASEERLWAGLTLWHFNSYTKYRWKITKDNTPQNIQNIKNHFFFGYGTRRSLSRNALSRLWWIGYLTYDDSRKDKYELTRFVCEHSDHIMHIIERNLSNNREIVRAFISAILQARQDGLTITTTHVGELLKYLNLLGGVYILDAMPYEFIYNKTLAKAHDLASMPSTKPNLT